ncbi:MAG: hypothetical protein IT371_26535 [Deltaproteobacteria bacterium]|nr:hypothetical protein [Deltaproteobacteria bacterium]
MAAREAQSQVESLQQDREASARDAARVIVDRVWTFLHAPEVIGAAREHAAIGDALLGPSGGEPRHGVNEPLLRCSFLEHPNLWGSVGTRLVRTFGGSVVVEHCTRRRVGGYYGVDQPVTQSTPVASQEAAVAKVAELILQGQVFVDRQPVGLLLRPAARLRLMTDVDGLMLQYRQNLAANLRTATQRLAERRSAAGGGRAD